MPCLRRIIAILLVLTALCQLSSFGQNSKPADILTKLSTYSKSYESEKLYLQFDKPYYATGDTLWFKAYLLKASYLTASSQKQHILVYRYCQ